MDILEYRGVEGLMVAEVTADTDASYTTGTPFELAGIATLTKATERPNETHYYNNLPAIVIQGAGQDTITISASALNVEDSALINNNFYDSQTGMACDVDGEIKYFALGYKTKKNNGDEVYVWRLKGWFEPVGEEANTIDAGTGGNGQSIVFHGISTIHEFTKTSGTARSVVVDVAQDKAVLTNFWTSVQTPDTITKKTP